MINKILYLGPKGSYSDIATQKFIEHYSYNDTDIEAVDSISEIIQNLCIADEGIFAVIPIENSIEGIVRDTQDSLTKLIQKGYKIFAETTLEIEHALVSYGEKEKITKIASHPQALAQCREYIYKNWGNNVELIPVLSTSNAIKALSEENPSFAAIGSEYCAKLYNIPILEKNINDEKNNTTRFILLNKEKPSKKILNKVSLRFSTENKPGALNKVLKVFEDYNLNLSYIDSRPSRKALGEYIFYVDFVGHIEDSNITLALTRVQPFVKSFEILSEGAEVI